MEVIHCGPRATPDHTVQRFFLRINNQAALGRQCAHPVMKLRFNGGEIRKNIGVIKLEIVQHRNLSAVMQKLGAFVEKRSVILIRFDHKIFAIT